MTSSEIESSNDAGELAFRAAKMDKSDRRRESRTNKVIHLLQSFFAVPAKQKTVPTASAATQLGVAAITSSDSESAPPPLGCSVRADKDLAKFVDAELGRSPEPDKEEPVESIPAVQSVTPQASNLAPTPTPTFQLAARSRLKRRQSLGSQSTKEEEEEGPSIPIAQPDPAQASASVALTPTPPPQLLACRARMNARMKRSQSFGNEPTKEEEEPPKEAAPVAALAPAPTGQLMSRSRLGSRLKRSQSTGHQPLFGGEDPSSKDATTPQQLLQQLQHPKMSANWNNVPVRSRRRKPSPNTIARRLTRKYKDQKSPSQWYHRVAAKNKLGSINEDLFLSDSESDDNTDGSSGPQLPTMMPHDDHNNNNDSVLSPLQQAKRDLLQALNDHLGDATTANFQLALQKLISHYDPTKLDPRKRPSASRTRDGFQQLEGIGISAGKPSFPGCIGRNAAGDPLFKLGTMSFGMYQVEVQAIRTLCDPSFNLHIASLPFLVSCTDMFCPTQLVVSVQGTFVLIDIVDGKNPGAVKHIPKDLLADVRFGKSPVRSYNLVTCFTIEPWKPEFGDNSPNKGITEDQPPLRGIMTTYGFILPYPLQNHRFSVWFTGGTLEVVDGDGKNEKWFQIFDKKGSASKSNNNPKDNDSSNDPATPLPNINHQRSMVESGKLLAAKMLMGASTNDQLDENGKLSYTLTRPMSNYIDLIYIDKKLQVLRGSSGTVYVHVRIPGRKAVRNSGQQQSNAMIASILNNDDFLMTDDTLGENNDMDESSSSLTQGVAIIDAETQARAKYLIEAGRLKEAAELLGNAHSGELKQLQQSRPQYSQAGGRTDRRQHNASNNRDSRRVRRAASESNLEGQVVQAPVKRCYAREA